MDIFVKGLLVTACACLQPGFWVAFNPARKVQTLGRGTRVQGLGFRENKVSLELGRLLGLWGFIRRCSYKCLDTSSRVLGILWKLKEAKEQYWQLYIYIYIYLFIYLFIYLYI